MDNEFQNITDALSDANLSAEEKIGLIYDCQIGVAM